MSRDTIDMETLDAIAEEYIGETLHSLAPEEVLGDAFTGDRLTNEEYKTIMNEVVKDFVRYVKYTE